MASGWTNARQSMVIMAREENKRKTAANFDISKERLKDIFPRDSRTLSPYI